MTRENREEMEDYLTDQVETAHNLITKLRQLLTMEKTGAVMDRSLNRTRFFKMKDDHGIKRSRPVDVVFNMVSRGQGGALKISINLTCMHTLMYVYRYSLENYGIKYSV